VWGEPGRHPFCSAHCRQAGTATKRGSRTQSTAVREISFSLLRMRTVSAHPGHLLKSLLKEKAIRVTDLFADLLDRVSVCASRVRWLIARAAANRSGSLRTPL